MVMKKNQRLMKIGDPDNNSKREKEKKLQTQNEKKWEKKNGGAEKNGTQWDWKNSVTMELLYFYFLYEKSSEN